MANTMPNGRAHGGYVKSQSEMDDLQARQVAALESIAKSLAKIAGGDFKVNATTKTASAEPKSLFGTIFGGN